MRRAEQLSVDVELALAPRAVADPHRGGLAPARQVRQLPLGQVPLAADAEHDLQVAGLLEGAGRGGGHVVEELVGLVGAGRHPQRLDGERGVPDPGVAVVPVAGAADDLGQRGGGRGADRAGGLERQRLEHPSAVVDEVAPRTDVGLVQLATTTATPPRCRPAAPRSRPRSTPGPSRRRPACCGAARSRPALPARRTNRPDADDPSTAKGTGHDRTRTSAPPVATSPPSTASSSGSTRPYSGRGAYSSVDLDLAARARHLPQQEMGRVPAQVVAPVALAHGQRVDDDRRPGGRAVGRLQHHRAIHVATGDRAGARRPQRPVARLLAQQPSEDRRAVEAREAQPVDRAVPAHQRRAVPIRQQGVVADRGWWSSSSSSAREVSRGRRTDIVAGSRQGRTGGTGGCCPAGLTADPCCEGLDGVDDGLEAHRVEDVEGVLSASMSWEPAGCDS